MCIFATAGTCAPCRTAMTGVEVGEARVGQNTAQGDLIQRPDELDHNDAGRQDGGAAEKGILFWGGSTFFPNQLAELMNDSHSAYSILALAPAVFFICPLSAQTRQGKQDGTAVLRLVMAVRQGAHVPAGAKKRRFASWSSAWLWPPRSKTRYRMRPWPPPGPFWGCPWAVCWGRCMCIFATAGTCAPPEARRTRGG